MKEKILDIIEEISGIENLRERESIDLLDHEVFDSLALVMFLNTLEDEFDIEIYPTQIDPSTWRDIDKITELVESLME
ncbi:MAG: D-alanine--poly(phosphoribitol) ligase subunit 2 [Clostridia bacterium]|nr:D-alanine--poly(phosphoribitol) ligase subunit 2 [Clostridia bacterium]